MQDAAPRPGFYLACASLLLTLAVVGLGAWTRLADAGLGCPDWPGCYGHLLWPDTPEEIERANRAWPDMPVIPERTVPEMVHRYAAGVLGALVLGLAAFAWRCRRYSDYPVRLGYLLLALVLFQALFGMWTVSLKLLPQVVSAHLLLGFGFSAALWLHILRLGARPRPMPLEIRLRLPRYRLLISLGLALAAAQTALGGWLTSNYAALACPDLPTCQGAWLPAADFAAGFNLLQSVGPNYLGGIMDNEARIAIHLAHRIGAVVCLLYLLPLSVMLCRSKAQNLFRAPALLLGLLLAAQFLLGLGNILLDFPRSVAVMHNLGALLLLLGLVWLLHRCQSAAVPRIKGLKV